MERKYLSMNNRSGQAVVELAVFGSLIILVFASLVSYIQHYNDQQYVQMSAFRQALGKAESPDTGGLSVQFTQIDNRKYSDPQGNYGKGSTQSVSASSSVYWAVPFVGESADTQVWYKVNDDAFTIDANTTVDNISTSTASSFNETLEKTETPSGIVNHDNSRLKETITTTALTENGTTAFAVTQGLYVGAGGQYGYSSAASGSAVEREKTWTTPF